MNFTDIIKPPMKPLGLRADEAERIIGIPSLFRQMVKAKWIKPIVDRHKSKLFSVADVEFCFLRLKNGEHPQDKPTLK